MNNLDLDLEDNAGPSGLFSSIDSEDIDILQKSIALTNFNLLCSKVCFKDYKQNMN